MITTDKTQLNINVLTQEQYEQAKADEILDADGLYMVPEDVAGIMNSIIVRGEKMRSNVITSVASNATANFQINIEKLGYTCLGVGSIYTDGSERGSYLIPKTWYINGVTLHVDCKNVHSSSSIPNAFVEVECIYVRNA